MKSNQKSGAEQSPGEPEAIHSGYHDQNPHQGKRGGIALFIFFQSIYYRHKRPFKKALETIVYRYALISRRRSRFGSGSGGASLGFLLSCSSFS